MNNNFTYKIASSKSDMNEAQNEAQIEAQNEVHSILLLIKIGKEKNQQIKNLVEKKN